MKSRDALFCTPACEAWSICDDFLDPAAEFLEDAFLAWAWHYEHSSEGPWHCPAHDTDGFLEALARLVPDKHWFSATTLVKQHPEDPPPFPTEFALTWLAINVAPAFSDLTRTLIEAMDGAANQVFHHDLNVEAGFGSNDPAYIDRIPQYEQDRWAASNGAPMTPGVAYRLWCTRERTRLVHQAEQASAAVIRHFRQSSAILRARFEHAPQRPVDTRELARKELRLILRAMTRATEQEDMILNQLWPPPESSVGTATYDDLAKNVWENGPSTETITSALGRLQKKIESKLESLPEPVELVFGAGVATLLIGDATGQRKRS